VTGYAMHRRNRARHFEARLNSENCGEDEMRLGEIRRERNSLSTNVSPMKNLGIGNKQI
jgi:hypothetical protein